MEIIMKEIFLVILFNFNGELTILDGFYPLVVEQIEECEVRKTFAESYLPTVENIPEVVGVFCGDEETINHEIMKLKQIPA